MSGSASPPRGTVAVAALILLWAAALLAGGGALLRYKNTPGAAGDTPRYWPSGSTVQLDATRATVLMFVHPDCPCSRASLRELATMAADQRNRMAVRVLIDRSSGTGDDVSMRELASRVLGAEIRGDDGSEAARFGARTSGTLVAYDTRGRLLFHGGITSSRGHEGDSVGRQRLLATIAGRPIDRADAPVFGCALTGAHAAVTERGGT